MSQKNTILSLFLLTTLSLSAIAPEAPKIPTAEEIEQQITETTTKKLNFLAKKQQKLSGLFEQFKKTGLSELMPTASSRMKELLSELETYKDRSKKWSIEHIDAAIKAAEAAKLQLQSIEPLIKKATVLDSLIDFYNRAVFSIPRIKPHIIEAGEQYLTTFGTELDKLFDTKKTEKERIDQQKKITQIIEYLTKKVGNKAEKELRCHQKTE